ncbi:MAG: hypothetical protein MdMp014T_2958 [Treponematales bacterium]
MILSRTATENALINKHVIKAMTIIDSTNEKFVEEVMGNELRTLNRYAPTYDFIANLIDKARRTGRIGRYIKDTGNYYSTWVSERQWKAYFAQCADHNIRRNLERQVFTDIQFGWVVAHGVDRKGNTFIRQIPPFRFMERRVYEDGQIVREVLFSKYVFESLVTEDCFKKKGDGYIELPANFFPLLTNTDRGSLNSFNPIYKLNVFGLYKNTHKSREVLVKREELIKTIAPEYLDTSGHLKNVTASQLHDSLIASTQGALTTIPDHLLVSNFYLGDERGMSRIFFRKPPPAPEPAPYEPPF